MSCINIHNPFYSDGELMPPLHSKTLEGILHYNPSEGITLESGIYEDCGANYPLPNGTLVSVCIPDDMTNYNNWHPGLVDYRILVNDYPEWTITGAGLPEYEIEGLRVDRKSVV